jgi:hypothetical protein
MFARRDTPNIQTAITLSKDIPHSTVWRSSTYEKTLEGVAIEYSQN